MAKGKMKKNICVFRDKMPPFYFSSRMFVQQKIDMYRNKWHLFIKYLLIEIHSRDVIRITYIYVDLFLTKYKRIHHGLLNSTGACCN